VQNCAQNGRKCTLFHPKTHFFAHFCRGEGRLFGRPKIGVLGGPGVARAAPPKTDFSSEKNPYSMQAPLSLSKYKIFFYIFYLRCDSIIEFQVVLDFGGVF
jgi:hypothetical protein